MTESVEVEVTSTTASMLAALEAEYGEQAVQADLQASVQQAVRNGYAAMQQNGHAEVPEPRPK